MDFLTTEATKYITGCLINFLLCMAIYIWSWPESLWSDSILPCLWSILRDWMQNTLTVWQHFVSVWQWGPLSQPACCQNKLENSPQSFGFYTVSQSRSVVTSAENPAPDNSPQSIGELRNGHVANLQELYYTRLVRKMAWYKILIQVLIV